MMLFFIVFFLYLREKYIKNIIFFVLELKIFYLVKFISFKFVFWFYDCIILVDIVNIGSWRKIIWY